MLEFMKFLLITPEWQRNQKSDMDKNAHVFTLVARTIASTRVSTGEFMIASEC